MDQDERYQRAKKRVADIKSFFTHLAVYVGVMVVLVIVDISDHGNWWFYWPLLGWGIAVAIHAFNVFGLFLGSGWEERKIKKLMDKESGD